MGYDNHNVKEPCEPTASCKICYAEGEPACHDLCESCWKTEDHDCKGPGCRSCAEASQVFGWPTREEDSHAL